MYVCLFFKIFSMTILYVIGSKTEIVAINNRKKLRNKKNRDRDKQGKKERKKTKNKQIKEKKLKLKNIN